MGDSRAIGVFDSGLGGLTLVKVIKSILPHEDVIYLGDTARVPYGMRSKRIVQKFAFEDANFLTKKNVKCIVVACNTASSLASGYLKKRIKVPIVDVVNSLFSIKELRMASSIGVIGTSATIKSDAHKNIISKINPRAKVIARACPLFVPLIEAGEVEGEILNLVIKKYLSIFKDTETLILGCTHYPIIKKEIEDYLPSVNLVDPALATGVRLKKFLQKNALVKKSKTKGKYKYFITDKGPEFERIAKNFLGEKLPSLIQKML